MKQFFTISIAAMLMCACVTHRPESLNAFGDSLVIAELDYENETAVDMDFINRMAGRMSPSSVQQAPGDRYIFLMDRSSKDELLEALSTQDAALSVFEHPFYDFNRASYSSVPAVERLTHVLMTCNMVADSLKQSEYLEYHARQNELFPEVAHGFNRAGYEQVLVYREGRRLMLVISFPQGESLEELDPLTVKDNPRVEEWNRIMSTYQENIDKPGEQPWLMYNTMN